MDGNATSPRLFWQARSFNSENTPIGERNGSPSPTRRSSIERLQKASRVKNSNILALEHKNEYDPTRVPQIERPLSKIQGNAFGGTGTEGVHSEQQQQQQRPLGGQQRTNSKTTIPFFSTANTPKLPQPQPATTTATGSSYANPQMSPSREQPSPTKSALSPTKFKSSFDAETGEWSSSGDNDTSGDDKDLPEGKYQHRHAKSVTFDAAPPQVNEYEMATPDISTVGSDSREGSYESEDDDDDYEDDPYYSHESHGHEDSFDASLEDLEKTPVVGPDDWRQGSHDNLDGYENSPMPDELPPLPRPQHSRTDSSTSNGDHRPLPPLPGMGMDMEMQRSTSAVSDGLSATAEHMVGAQRDLPSPPPVSSTKSEIQNIGNGKMSLEERLRLMMLSDDTGKSAAELQRERRMRRAGTKDRHSLTSEPELHSPVQSPVHSPLQSPGPIESSPLKADEEAGAEDTLGDLSALDDYELPQRISRESILRRVNGNKSFEREGTTDYQFSSPPPSSSPERPYASYDPDVPLPSTEDSLVADESEDEGSVIINRDAAVEIYDEVSEYFDRSESEMSGRYHDHDVADTEDSGSRYSDEEPPKLDSVETDDEGATTPRATTPTGEPEQLVEVNQDDLQDALKDVKGDITAGMDAHTLPKPEEPQPVPEPEHRLSKIPSHTRRPSTPPLSKPEYDGSGWGDPEEDSRYDKEPGTPDSVIHNPMEDVDFDAPPSIEAPEPVPSPAIPEQVATIKSASGSKLKTRPSATPSDIAAMREARRQVSLTMPDVPAIPERHRNRLSRDVENELPQLPNPFSASDDYMDRHPSFKKRSLTLDLDLGLSLENEFDRVVEQQKVAYDSSYVFPPVSFPSTVKGRTPSTTIARKASSKLPLASSHSATTPAPDVLANNANITSRKQRGYLMRQNTKLVAASDKETEDFRSCRSAGNSPVKGTRPQSWTVEPWNGRPRQRSIRNRKPVPTGPVPPLPGQESNAATVATATTNALKSLTEEDLNVEMAGPESGERGRLFVKVMGVKDLDLPLPRSKPYNHARHIEAWY